MAELDIAKYVNNILEEAGIDAPAIVGDIIVAAIVFIAALLIGATIYYLFEKFLNRWAKKTKTTLDDKILKNIKAPVYFFVILIGVYYGLKTLKVVQKYPDAARVISVVFTVAEILLVTLIIIRVINVFISWYAERSKTKKRVSNHLLFILKKILQLVVVIFASLAILAAFNVDLTGAMVGLGVGGIAIAFALQNVLSDLFSAFSIYFDRPYEIGDFIIIGNDMGVVKKIGIQSTRIQTLQGEELVISNKEMVNTRIRNFKQMQKRRIVFGFGVTYDTPLEKLKKIPNIVRKIIEDTQLAEPDRTHFKEYGDFSLNYEVVYYVDTGDYNKYMDTQQEINFRLKEEFKKEGIEFAYPSQTIFLKEDT
ncbi:MAG: mechanosensitive ion channel family protein [Candidatus Thermoplasmatota archaeon]